MSLNSKHVQKSLDQKVSDLTDLNFSTFFTDIRIAKMFSISFLTVNLWILSLGHPIESFQKQGKKILALDFKIFCDVENGIC